MAMTNHEKRSGGALTTRQRAEDMVRIMIQANTESYYAYFLNQLDEAVSVAVREACEKLVDRHGDIVVDILIEAKDEGIKKGFASARKKAAGIAEELCWKNHGDDDCLKIAERIRAMEADK